MVTMKTKTMKISCEDDRGETESETDDKERERNVGRRGEV